MLGQGNNVVPGLLVEPVELLVFIIDSSTGLEEHSNIYACQDFILDENSHAHHELEGNLVAFEDTSIDIAVGLVGQSVTNVSDSVLNNLGLGRVVNTIVEDIKELQEGDVIHPVDVSHFDDTEIDNRTASSDGSESLTLNSNFFGSLLGFFERLFHFSRLGFNVTKHVNELNIIKERSFGGSKSLKEISFEFSKGLLG